MGRRDTVFRMGIASAPKEPQLLALQGLHQYALPSAPGPIARMV